MSISDVLLELEILRELIINNNEQHKKVVRRLTSEILNLRHDIRQLSPGLRNEQNSVFVDEANVLPLFPLDTCEDLQDLEENLKKNDIMLKQFKSLLLRTGEENTKMPDFIRTALKKLITDELAASYSWTGTNVKPSAKNMKFISLIREACHHKYRNAQDIIINPIIHNHFLHAKDRIKKRQKKLTNKD